MAPSMGGRAALVRVGVPLEDK